MKYFPVLNDWHDLLVCTLSPLSQEWEWGGDAQQLMLQLGVREKTVSLLSSCKLSRLCCSSLHKCRGEEIVELYFIGLKMEEKLKQFDVFNTT